MEGFGGEWDFCDSIVLVLVILKKFVIYWSAEPRRLGIGTVERWSSFGERRIILKALISKLVDFLCSRKGGQEISEQKMLSLLVT